MGQKNLVMNHYFRNKERFADLFNGVYFQGEKVINGEDLTEISGIYEESEEALMGEERAQTALLRCIPCVYIMERRNGMVPEV